MNREEKHIFYDEYKDGRKDYYYLTFGELEDTFGLKNAMRIWKCGYVPDDVIPLPINKESNSIPYESDYNSIISSYLFDD